MLDARVVSSAKLAREFSASTRRLNSSRPAATECLKEVLSIWISSTFRKRAEGYRTGTIWRANVVFPAPLAPAIRTASGKACSKDGHPAEPVYNATSIPACALYLAAGFGAALRKRSRSSEKAKR